MKRMELRKVQDELYGIKYVNDGNNCKAYDYFMNTDLSLPFAETVFTILEMSEAINKIADIYDSRSVSYQNKISNKHNILTDRFKSLSYDMTPLFEKFEIDTLEARRILRIKDYVELCCDNSSYCNLNALESLAVGLYDSNDNILSLFSPFGSLRVRKYETNQKLKLPFFLYTSDLFDYLDNNYTEYIFYSYTHYDRLSELCICSLYEIFKLQLFISKCQNCKHYFISTCKQNSVCMRQLPDNDYQGCIKYKSYLANRQMFENDYMVLYRRVYCRLEKRARKCQKEDVKNFENFKSNWKEVRKTAKQISDTSERINMYKEYLLNERWK